MDLIQMKSFVSYRYDTITWNAIRPATMGYQAVKSGSNVYYNFLGDAYQLTKKVGDLSGNVNVISIIFIKLINNIVGHESKFCLNVK